MVPLSPSLSLNAMFEIKERTRREAEGPGTKIRGDPINQDPYSPSEKSTKVAGEKMKGTVRCPPFRVCLCTTVESGIASAAAASSMGPGTDATRPAWWVESAGDRGEER